MRTEPLREALGEEIFESGNPHRKNSRAGDQSVWGNTVKICRGCTYTGKDTVFEFIRYNGRQLHELHYYSNIPFYGKDEEKCPRCSGETNFQIITDGMKTGKRQRDKTEDEANIILIYKGN